ncbi:amidohydrolase family protein [Marinomonas sp. IMCC 4694]|uniref:amidohydrolase family protein n=1 Tax=Marinomonas sp. IMCC 4694 TaxID=2605432 RepID=UPI0011E6F1BA|nr:amidohydrolase family protein [Marinomonas sp. IMCC 4694]TYL48952.1 amidohydrolase family protein [Marinomonas sp. IMCC 4694]
MPRTLTGPSPLITLPAGSVDTHIHVYDAKHAGMPGGPAIPVDAANLTDYRHVQAWLGLEKVVITQPNAYQTNNTCLLEALDELGDIGRGVAVVTTDIDDATLQAWHDRGVRGARIMELTLGAVRLKDLLAVNAKIRPLDWTCIVQFNGRDIVDHSPLLEQIQGDYVIDHHAKFLPPVTPDSKEFDQLLRLIDKGNCYYKIAACYESSATGGPDYDDIAAMSKRLIDHAPERIIWGSNWPHVSGSPTEAPNDVALLNTITSWMPDEKTRQMIFVDNPNRLYWRR